MEKIPTAKLFRETKLMDSSKPYTEEEIMIEFTKLHVEAALKEASEKASVYADEGGFLRCICQDAGFTKVDFTI